MSTTSFKGAIFDLDGVITQTARIHFKAWEKTFNSYLEKKLSLSKKKFSPFTYEDDYLPFVDGKPRYQGVKSFLESRNIDIPFGQSSDSPDQDTICGIGNTKNKAFKKIVAEEGVEIYQPTVDFIKDLIRRGIKVAVASSSKNCKYILQKTGLIDLFQTVIGGMASKELELKGKPAPDIFLAAASNLRLQPNECIMVEDAISGVQAGRNGNFSLVLGLARNGDIESLMAHGADIAIEDMKEISYKSIKDWFKNGIENDSWQLNYYGFDPEKERLRETLTTVGNGYFATRGCFTGSKADEVTHYPGTYIAGLYNKLPSIVFRKTIYNNDFVNAPNWLPVQIKIGDEDFINPFDMEIISYKHSLDIKNAEMTRTITFKNDKGQITQIRTRRIAGMHDSHLGGIQYKFTLINHSNSVTIRSTLDGTIINYGVARYRELNSKHLQPISVNHDNSGISLSVKTTTSKISIYVRSKSSLFEGSKKIKIEKKISKDLGIISEDFTIKAEQKTEYVFEKLISIYTSKDVTNPEEKTKSALLKTKNYIDMYKKHIKAWEKLWEIADFNISGDRFSQKAVRLHIYHLLVSASPHNKNIDAGMPARGLHGEAYRGHIFWDELFIFPFFNLHFPDITKSLLMYRYNRIDAARQYAKENGYKGAMYPWQTADDGTEETQILHFNPVSGKWDPDLSRRQRHVSVSIAYNVWEYYYCTHDIEFLHGYGAEMMLEIARFWTSISSYDKKSKRYHINGVMGPDEFHEKKHKSMNSGINDNAYTNIMVSWLMHKAIEMVENLPNEVMKKIFSKINFKFSEIEKWKDIVSKMNLIISEEGIISQFDGYMNLKELNWEAYRNKYGNIHRMDRILKSEGDTPDKYKVAKQADVLMIFYTLSPGQVKNILNIMGYKINDEIEFMKKNYEYYVKRTSHGSTLSHVVHSSILKYLHSHKNNMWEWFLSALKSDINDTQGGTTAEGIHSGVMAGTINIIVASFAGINLFKHYIKIEPNLPAAWEKLNFKVLHSHNLIEFTITADSITVKYISGKDKKAAFLVGGTDYSIDINKSVTINY